MQKPVERATAAVIVGGAEDVHKVLIGQHQRPRLRHAVKRAAGDGEEFRVRAANSCRVVQGPARGV